MPVVMIPVDFDIADQSSSYRHSFVLRPFITNDFMTGLAAVPGKHIPEKVRFFLLFRRFNKLFKMWRKFVWKMLKLVNFTRMNFQGVFKYPIDS